MKNINTIPTEGAIFYKSVNYKITILKLTSPVPPEFEEDFIAWLEWKSLQCGFGKHCEYYYDHDESGKSWIEVVIEVS